MLHICLTRHHPGRRRLTYKSSLDDKVSLFNFAVTPSTSLSRDERAQEVVNNANRVGAASSAPVKAIAGELARSTFLRFQLLPDEFVAIFDGSTDTETEKSASTAAKPFSRPVSADSAQSDPKLEKNVDKLAEILVHTFIESLYHQKMSVVKTTGHSIPDSPDTQAFKSELIGFLREYHKTKVTLHDFLTVQGQIYPDVDIHFVFEDPSVRSLFVQQVSRACLPEIKSAYTALYREDPDHFISQYLHKRVLAPLSTASVHQKTLVRVAGNIDRLFDYLVHQGYQLESIYMLLYKQLAEWRDVVRHSQDIRGKIERLNPDLLVEPTGDQDAGMLDPHFDFDAFFKRHLRSAMIKARNKDLPKKPRHIDLQIKGWDLLIAPSHALDPFKEMADLALASDPSVFSKKLRTFFSYPVDPKRLSDGKMYEILARQLELASGEQIRSTLEEALKLFPKDDPIYTDFAFCEPILQCRNPKDLIIWLAYPDRFSQEFSEFSHVPYHVVSFQARRMLEHLVLYRGAAFVSDFKDRKKKRDRIQNHLIEALSITETERINYSYRVLVQVDPTTHEPIFADQNGNGNGSRNDDEKLDSYYYDVITPESPAWKKNIKSRAEYTVRHDGKTFKALPVETKKFITANIAVPQPHGAPREMEILFYSDDKNILSVKSLKSFLLSLIRGKLPTDLVRCMIVFPPGSKEEDKKILLDFLYDYASHVVKLEHHKESRQIGKKARSSRSTGSASFSDDRLASFSSYAIFLEDLPDNIEKGLTPEDLDALQHGRYGFEIQVMDMNSVCITASDHTVSSHHMTYTPERAWDVCTKTLCPPIIMGSRSAAHALRGFRGDR